MCVCVRVCIQLRVCARLCACVRPRWANRVELAMPSPCSLLRVPVRVRRVQGWVCVRGEVCALPGELRVLPSPDVLCHPRMW